MTNPITPPPELVHQWHKEACKDPYHGGTFFESKTLKHIATQAAQWGADQELEACCKWTAIVGGADALRAARRPKPPSLKEQALQLLETYNTSGVMLTADQADTIRAALEALDD
jgi:hypothetical protein